MADKKPEWSEFSRDVSTIVRYLRPLLRLENIPAAIEAAKTEIAAAEQEVTNKQGEIQILERKIAAQKDRLSQVDEAYNEAVEKARKEMSDDQMKLVKQYNKEIKDLQDAKAAAANQLASIKDQADKERQKMNDELAGLQKQIEEKVLELTGYQTALANILKGK